MAGVAIGRQHWTNTRFKKLDLLGGLLSEPENSGRDNENCGFPARHGRPSLTEVLYYLPRGQSTFGFISCKISEGEFQAKLNLSRVSSRSVLSKARICL